MSTLTSVAHPESPAIAPVRNLKGKRVGMVLFSTYPADPRPHRAAEALLREGMSVDLICLREANETARERHGGLDVIRVPLTHRRGNKLSYMYKYSAFIVVSAAILAWRSIRRRYDLIYVHNMPDILVISALVPKMLGAKVILDQHDPMPEVMKTIFGLDERSFSVLLLTWLEKWSIASADRVITVNAACKRIFGSRSCSPKKIAVVMNSPDEEIFPFQAAQFPTAIHNPIERRFVMMYHGSLVERNGLDLAVEALAKVRLTFPRVELRIFGRETPFLQAVMGEVQAQGLSGYVSYLGPRTLEALVGEIKDCDVGVIPNQRSAFADINTPTRIFEYLALGKPVIAPRTSGIEDYFGPDSLMYFDCGDAADLARAMVSVASHYSDAIENARRGQQVYLAHTWTQERNSLIEAVSTLLSRQGSARSQDLGHGSVTASLQSVGQTYEGHTSAD
jgi:glycosyltransferase involved in cell wall biosynthesis